jgi:hypothetical protein
MTDPMTYRQYREQQAREQALPIVPVVEPVAPAKPVAVTPTRKGSLSPAEASIEHDRLIKKITADRVAKAATDAQERASAVLR